MQLLDHNAQTLDEVNSFVNNGLDCCVVNPCGSGKTSVMAAFIEQHLSDTFTILTKQKNAIAYYRNRHHVFRNQNINIVTYTKFAMDYKNNQIDKYDTTFFLIDEAHYIGAPLWGKALATVREEYDPICIGFTATPQRFEDQGSADNIVNQYFGDNVAGNFSTKQLAKNGVFVEPEYVLSLYNLKNIIDDKMLKIDDSELSEPEKIKLINKLTSTLQKWENESEPSKILAQHLPSYMYRENNNRILVYVSDVSEIDAKRKYIDKTIKSIFPEKRIQSYIYTYQTNESGFNHFLTDDNSYIKILYSIDKIMETIHIDDLRIAIMLRPSVSNRIITQQFGRLNSITNQNKPIIFDMVDNLSNIQIESDKLSPFAQSDHPFKHNRQSDIELPHISYYANVFSMIDKATSRTHYYQYKNLVGTLTDICNVYECNKADLLSAMNKYPLEIAIEKTSGILNEHKPLTKHKIDAEVFDEETIVPDFKLTDIQREYAESHMSFIDNFIKQRCITDDDIKQELYIRYLFVISKTVPNAITEWIVHQKILLDLRAHYTRICKRRVLREQIFTPKPSTIHNTPNAYLMNWEMTTCHEIQNAIKTAISSKLTEKEQKVLTLRFGLSDDGVLTLDNIAKTMGLTRTRIGQIENKAIRKLSTYKVSNVDPDKLQKIGLKIMQNESLTESETILFDRYQNDKKLQDYLRDFIEDSFYCMSKDEVDAAKLIHEQN